MAEVLGDPVVNELEQAINKIDLMVTLNQLPQLNDHLFDIKQRLQSAITTYTSHTRALANPRKPKKTKLW